jgi:hypothetical protein
LWGGAGLQRRRGAIDAGDRRWKASGKKKRGYQLSYCMMRNAAPVSSAMIQVYQSTSSQVSFDISSASFALA